MSKFGDFMFSKKFISTISFLGLYMLSTGASWAIFTYVKDAPSVSYTSGDIADIRSKIAELPKTEECPINGKMFSEPERKIWEGRRPITAMIENHEESRPLEGLDRADIVYEAVSEGGVTRFMGVFYCGVSVDDVRLAPIRSARIYFISWAAEYGTPIFTHVGGANNLCSTCPGGVKYKGQVSPKVQAIEKLVDLGWRVAKGNDFDTTYDTGFPTLFRDPERLGKKIALEHTMVGTTDKIFEQAEERGFAYRDSEGNAWDENFKMWNFVDEKPASSPEVDSIEFEFWSNAPLYDVVWKYDTATNSYLRENGGVPMKDLNSGNQISSKNVVIQFVEEEGPVDTEKHMFYETVGEGDAIFFMNGEVTKGTWEKEKFTGRTIYYDESGDEIEFVRGEVWIEAVPNGNDIVY